MVDNTPGLLQTCEARGIAAGFRRGLRLDLRCFEYIRKVFQKHTPSVIKQPGSKCFKEACIVFLIPHAAHFECLASSHGDSTLHNKYCV